MRISYSVPPEDLWGQVRDNGDPLGFRSVATAIARDLVPGLTQSTNVGRGFSLVCLGLHFARVPRNNGNVNSPNKVNKRYLRFERLMVLAARERDPSPSGFPFPGVRSADRLLQRDPVSLEKPLLTNELGSGLWGAYRRAAIEFGLIELRQNVQSRRSTKPADHRLTKSGTDLVKRASDRILEGHHVRPTLDGGFATRNYLKHLNVTGTCSPKERTVLRRALGSFDKKQGGAHRRLATSYAEQGTLDLSSLKVEGWPDSHRRAAEAARAVTRLIDTYEKVIRLAAIGQDEQTHKIAFVPVPAADWDLIGRWDRVGLTRLRDLIAPPDANGQKTMHTSGGPSAAVSHATVLDRLFDFHQMLAAERGGLPWERGQEPIGRSVYNPPDFALSSAESLYAEGITPNG